MLIKCYVLEVVSGGFAIVLLENDRLKTQGLLEFSLSLEGFFHFILFFSGDSDEKDKDLTGLSKSISKAKS